MYKTENLTVNAGNLAPGLAVAFDLVIKSRWCKITALKIVQLTVGDMDIMFEVWESTAAQGDPANRANLYQQPIMRPITVTAVQGAQYGESFAGNPIPYFDRDDPEVTPSYRLHCRLVNNGGGFLSDFSVSLTIADIGENA